MTLMGLMDWYNVILDQFVPDEVPLNYKTLLSILLDIERLSYLEEGTQR